MPFAVRPIRLIFLVTLLLAPGAATAGDNASLAKARAMFEKYVALSNNFDASVAEFYDDDAELIAFRTYPFGKTRRLSMRGADYKAMIDKIMPLARMRGDRNEFSDVTYAPEGAGVRIRATRRSLMKNYSAPHSVLVVPDDTGAWRIQEEIANTRP